MTKILLVLTAFIGLNAQAAGHPSKPAPKPAPAPVIAHLQSLSCTASNGVTFNTLQTPSSSSDTATVQTQWGMITKSFTAKVEAGAKTEAGDETVVVLESKDASYSIALQLDLKSHAVQDVTGTLMRLASNESEFPILLAGVDCQIALQ